MPSEAFLAFEASLEHTDPRVFVYDLDALRRLPAGELPAVQAILDARIRAGNVRAMETALAAGYVGLVPALTTQLDVANAAVRDASARALASLTGAPDAIARVIADLRAGPTDIRIQAAHELARTRTRAARAALRGALVDPEAIVRAHAWMGLVGQLGVADLAEVRPSPLGVLVVRLYTGLTSVRLAAAATASALFERLDAGQTAFQLGLDVSTGTEPAAVGPFVDSLDVDLPAIDVAAVRSLDGGWRAWPRRSSSRRWRSGICAPSTRSSRSMRSPRPRRSPTRPRAATIRRFVTRRPPPVAVSARRNARSQTRLDRAHGKYPRKVRRTAYRKRWSPRRLAGWPLETGSSHTSARRLDAVALHGIQSHPH